jgi:exodeoxyribonuclease VII large subunit
MPPSPQVISVSEFLGIINETLGFAYPQVVIEGEVSSFKVNQQKFIFFDLKDESGVLSCFMMIHQLKLPIEDGMKVRVTGTPKVTKFSKFSLTVRDIELAGEGELRRAMELLKRKLEAEGLFDPARKRPLPAFPHRIGLITSGDSAAYADFIKILGARWGGLDIILADVSVQGASAPDQIVGAVEYFNMLPHPVDVLVIIRGGGSLEDLMAFSTEPVARAVAASRTPTIVGVGHEVDVSLADYAADLRAATPTDAARLVVPDRAEIAARVRHLAGRIETHLRHSQTTQKQRIAQATTRLEGYLTRPKQRLTELESRLWRGLDQHAGRIRTTQQQTSGLEQRLTQFERLIINDRRLRLQHLQQLLHGYNPTAVLSRGYAIVRHHDQIVRRPSEVKTGDQLVIQLAQDTLTAQATDQ